MPEMFVTASAVRWVDDEPFPGVVEVELADADRRTWTFIDKAAVFDRDNTLGPASHYPIEVKLACTVVERHDDRGVISTAEPWGIETVEQQSTFTVHCDQLR
jgi:hypothetical protein